MEQHRTGLERGAIAVFALGWACDYRIVEHVEFPAGCDALYLYDWRAMPSSEEVEALRREVAGYETRYLIAWSFGVWAAERLFEGMSFTRAVALNGTPLPADDRRGMGARRLALTLRGLPAQSMEGFLRRAYGEAYERLLPILTPRNPDSTIAELAMLIAESSKPYTPSLVWDVAVVGSADVIFPPENMAAYWGAKAKIVSLPHYPFENAALIGAILGF